MKLLYEGKSKCVYVKNGDTLLIEFKDDVTAMDGIVKAVAKGKGVINARISAYLFQFLENAGIKTHYIGYDGVRTLVVKKLSMIPIEVIVRNYAYGSLLKRMPLYKPLQKLDPPLVELHLKDDSLHDPLILIDDVINVGLLTKNELETLIEISLKVDEALTNLFTLKGLTLVDMKLEFGRDKDRNLVLADEISGDTFRVLDENGKHLDKEVFRKFKDVNLMMRVYTELCRRLGVKVDDFDIHG